jgi:hypothetical protein
MQGTKKMRLIGKRVLVVRAVAERLGFSGASDGRVAVGASVHPANTTAAGAMAASSFWRMGILQHFATSWCLRDTAVHPDLCATMRLHGGPDIGPMH